MLGVVVHDRLHDRLARSWAGWGIATTARPCSPAGSRLWSFATVGTAFSDDFWHIFFWRSLLGIGEASYGVIAPTLIADLFPVKERGRAMGVYYLALPLGGALGYGVGAWIGQDYGWRAAFWVVGLPGLLAAAAGLVMIDPGRGASEGKHDRRQGRSARDARLPPVSS